MVDDAHLGRAGGLAQRGAVRGGHAADQPLTLALRQGHREPGRLRRSLACSQDYLGDSTPHETAEVEPRPAAKLLELEAPQLGQGFVFGELAREQPAQYVLQSPASTSRMRCQCVPAQ